MAKIVPIREDLWTSAAAKQALRERQIQRIVAEERKHWRKRSLRERAIDWAIDMTYRVKGSWLVLRGKAEWK